MNVASNGSGAHPSVNERIKTRQETVVVGRTPQSNKLRCKFKGAEIIQHANNRLLAAPPTFAETRRVPKCGAATWLKHYVVAAR